MKANRRNRTAYKTILIPLALALTFHECADAQDKPQVSLNLSQAIDLALRQNRTLRLAGLGVTDSEHKKEVARSAYLPHISNQSNVLHVTELAGVQIPAGAFGCAGSDWSDPCAYPLH